MPSPFTFNDPRFHGTISGTDFVSLVSHPFNLFFTALSDLTIKGGVNTIALSGTSYVMTCKDTRTYNATLNAVTGTRQISTSPFVLAELLSHNPLIEGVLALMAVGVYSISVTFI